MTKTRLLALLASAALAAPLAYAHVDGSPYGLPKAYCEDVVGDQTTHDYGPPGSGSGIFLGGDGSVPAFNGQACTYDDLVADQWDGHFEFAHGGAWLLACESACGDGTGAGSLVCFGTYADHLPFPNVWVFDHALNGVGAAVQFSVYADTLDNVADPTGEEDKCGDFESDFGAECVDHCAVPFPPGLDGSYQVYVTGSAGHVWTDAQASAAECSDGLDNDGDGAADWPADPDCAGPADDNEGSSSGAFTQCVPVTPGFSAGTSDLGASVPEPTHGCATVDPGAREARVKTHTREEVHVLCIYHKTTTSWTGASASREGVTVDPDTYVNGSVAGTYYFLATFPVTVPPRAPEAGAGQQPLCDRVIP